MSNPLMNDLPVDTLPCPAAPVSAFDAATVRDAFAWLRDDSRSDIVVAEHLEQENAETDAALAVVADVRDSLAVEFAKVLDMGEESPAVPDGPFSYLTRRAAGQEYWVWLRRDADGAEQVIVDPNVESDGGMYDVGALTVSDDHRLVAWTVDAAGDEEYVCHVRVVDSGEPVASFPAGSDCVAFDRAGEHVWVVRRDEAARPFRVVRVRLSDLAETVVLEEPDERFWVGLGVSSDERFTIVTAASKRSSQSWLLDRDEPAAPAVLVADRVDGLEYDVDCAAGHPLLDDRLLALIGDVDSGRRWLAAGRPGDPIGSWEQLWEPPTGVVLEDVSPASACHLAVGVRVNGFARVAVLHSGCGPQATPGLELEVLPAVSASDPVTVALVPLPQWDTDALWWCEDSFTSPDTTWSRPVCRGTAMQVHAAAVPDGYDASRYEQGVLHVTAGDGTDVPVSWFAAAGVRPRGVVLYGYGAYGIHDDPGFVATWPALADRGLVLAIAHVRGGGEFGESWHAAGRLSAKPTSFTDFVACARAVKARFGVDRVVARGGSAGGLLVGAALNLAPEEFCGVVAEVPFVDCLATMSDPSLPLTVTEYDEWGDPSDPVVAALIGSYTPTLNVRPAGYPPVLATAGVHDPRVGYWEPAIWVQVLRAGSTSGAPALLRVDGHGHAGASQLSMRLAERAEQAAFTIGCVDGVFG